MKIFYKLIILVLSLFMMNHLWCGDKTTVESSKEKHLKHFVLTSKSFRANFIMPAKFAREAVKGGKNISPQFTWENAPIGTKSFALLCIDMHPVAHRWIHWMVINIPTDIKSLPENASIENMPKGAVELKNSFGDRGWGGPQPPRGTGYHKYVFALYALNIKKIKSFPKNEKEFLKAIHGKVLGKAISSARLKQ